MTTPSSFTTAFRTIQLAMRNAGLLGEGEVPNSDQLAEYLPRLNDLVNVWCTQGLKLFLWEDISITLVQGQALYTLTPGGNVNMTKPFRSLQSYFLDSNGIRRPLIALSWDEYLRLPQVNQEGSMNSYFVDKQATVLNVTFWMPPNATDATGTGHLLVETQPTGYVSLTDSSAFPPEWSIALQWGLADEICTGQPQAIMQRCQQRAMAYRTALENWDMEDAPTQFTPDQRVGYAQGAFK